MYWKKLLWTTTLSCRVGSIRLHLGCPWRVRRYTIVPEGSVQYWYLFLFPPPFAMLLFHFVSDQWGQYRKYFWRFSFILQSWIAPSSPRCTCCPWRRRWINFFDISQSECEYFLGSTSVQVLFSIRTVLGEEPSGSRLCCFALAFDRLAKSPAFNLNAYSSNCTSEVSCSLLFKFLTNLFWSTRNSYPLVRIVFVHIHNSDFNSRIYFACNKLQLPIWAQFWCSLGSILLVVMLLLLEECIHDRPLHEWNCENSAVSFVMKYCPISTTLRNLASILNLLNLSCCDSFSIRSPYCCNKRSLLARSSQSKGTSVLITLSTSEELDCLPTTVAPINRAGIHTLHISLRLLSKDWADLQKQ